MNAIKMQINAGYLAIPALSLLSHHGAFALLFPQHFLPHSCPWLHLWVHSSFLDEANPKKADSVGLILNTGRESARAHESPDSDQGKTSGWTQGTGVAIKVVKLVFMVLLLLKAIKLRRCLLV